MDQETERRINGRPDYKGLTTDEKILRNLESINRSITFFVTLSIIGLAAVALLLVVSLG